MIRAITFGFEGVILDEIPMRRRLFERVLAETGAPADALPELARLLGSDDNERLAAALSARGGAAAASRASRLVARLDSYTQDEIHRQGYPLDPGAVRLVRTVATGGLGAGVVSRAIRHEVEAALRQAGLLALVRVIVSGDELGGRESDSAGFRAVLERFNEEPIAFDRLLHPHEVLAIESSPSGIEAAAAAGLRTLAVANRYPPEALERADAVVPSLARMSLDSLLRPLPAEPGDAIS